MPELISMNLQTNFIEFTLCHECFPLYLLHISGTPFPRNTSGWLLLTIPHKNPETNLPPPIFNVVCKYLR